MFDETQPVIIHSFVVFFSYILLGGHFAIFPAIFSKIFGNKLGNFLYSLSFCGYAVSAVISFMLYYICNTINAWSIEVDTYDKIGSNTFSIKKYKILYIACLIMCYLSMVPLNKFSTNFKYRPYENLD